MALDFNRNIFYDTKYGWVYRSSFMANKPVYTKFADFCFSNGLRFIGKPDSDWLSIDKSQTDLLRSNGEYFCSSLFLLGLFMT